jgi:PAS domain S-box-containing protein
MTINVLMVDDDSVHLELSERFLCRQSPEYRVATVKNSNDAIKQLMENEFDVAICDIDLSNDTRNGLDILEYLRGEGNDVPVIIFTGKSREEFAIQALNLGADYYIRKSSSNVDALYAELSYYILTAVEKRRTKKALKESEQKLRESEARLAEAQRIAHSGSWVWDIFENKEIWSDEIFRIFGLAPQTFPATYEAFLSSVHPGDRELVKAAVENALKKNVPYSINHRIVRPNGEIRYVHEEGEVTFNEIEEAVMMMGTVQDTTDLVRAEKQLRDERDIAKKYLELADAMMLALDASFNVTAINRKGCEILEYEENEVIGKNWIKCFISKPDRSGAKKHLQSLLKSNGTINPCCSAKLLARSGNIKHILCHDTVVFDDEGQVNTILCSAQLVSNIDDTAKQESSLQNELAKERSDWWQAVFDNAPAAIGIFDSEGLLIESNNAAVELLGVKDRKALLGLSLFKDSQLPKNVLDGVQRGEQQKFDYIWNFNYVKRRGILDTSRNDVVYMEVVLSVLRDAKGNTRGYVLNATDTTDRHQAEQEVIQSRESYKELYGNAPIGLFRVRISDGMILEYNHHFAQFFSTEGNKRLVDGSSVFRDFLSSPEDWEGIKGKLKQTEKVGMELEVIGADGRGLWMRSLFHLLPERGYIEGVMSDVTQQKEAVTMLEKQRAELSDFAHSMSHDLKNIFQNMQGFIELAEDEKDIKHLQRLYGLIKEAGDVLDHSVVLADAGLVVEENFTDVDLNKLVSSIASSAIPDSIGYTQDRLPVVKADMMKITQVFRNLFDNAVKHGQPSNIRVSLAERDGWFGILISNDGLEIPEQHRSKLFQRGFTTGRNGKGFGLVIAKRIVEAHKWKLFLKDDIETTFEILIPRK